MLILGNIFAWKNMQEVVQVLLEASSFVNGERVRTWGDDPRIPSANKFRWMAMEGGDF